MGEWGIGNGKWDERDEIAVSRVGAFRLAISDFQFTSLIFV
jgi:hypothetical protein